VPQPGCHVLLVLLRSSIERTFSKLAEPIVFYLSRKLPENRDKRLLNRAETHNYVARTLYPVPTLRQITWSSIREDETELYGVA
jgi:hypothetical protein